MRQERKTTYNTFAVLFYINRQKVKKNGLCSLMGRISINTEVAQFSTKMEVQPDLWDAKAYRLTGKSRTAKETNARIDRLEEDIRRYYKEILDEQGYITAELVKNAVNGGNTSGSCWSYIVSIWRTLPNVWGLTVLQAP